MHRQRRLFLRAVTASALLLAPPVFAGAADTDAVDKPARSGLGSEADKPQIDPPAGMPNPDTLPARSGLGSEADRGEPVAAGPVQHMQIQRSGNVTYLIGGVGPEQRQAMKQMSDSYNLEIAMPAPHGEYFGGGALEIENSSGTSILSTQIDAPMVLANLPAGSYTINLTAGGRTTSREVTIPASGRQEIALAWPSHPMAGDAPAPR